MKRVLCIAFLVLTWISPPSALRAQFSGSVLLESQVGNIPFTDPGDLKAAYGQLNLKYRYKKLTAFSRLEGFGSDLDDRSYAKPSQYGIAYKDKNYELKAGHLYEILGRGLMFRAYEVPGTLIEAPGARVKQGFYRDLFGVSGSARISGLRLKAFRGKYLESSLPATFDEDERRIDLVSAVEARYKVGPLDPSLRLMQLDGVGDATNFLGLSSGIELTDAASLYFEYSKELTEPTSEFDEQGRAFFASGNFIQGDFFLSAEYKDYKAFILGNGINEPPPAIKEHDWVTLNRSTHILFPDNERGFQVEASLTRGDHLFTANVSRAVNKIVEDQVFGEFFLEANLSLPQESRVRFFGDISQDPLTLAYDRYAGGLSFERTFSDGSSSYITFEHQIFERSFRSETINNKLADVANTVVRVNYSRGNLRTALLVDRSNDPSVTDKPNTTQTEDSPRYFVGGNLAYTFNRKHYANLFLGSRRGGPACTGGICYEVLDFRGIELRLTTKF